MITTILMYLGIVIGTIVFFCIYVFALENLVDLANDIRDKGGRLNKFISDAIVASIYLSALGIIALPFVFFSLKTLLFTVTMIACVIWVLHMIGKSWR